MILYNDGFLRIETAGNNTAFYCMPCDYNFIPLNIAHFIIKKLNEDMKHGYDMLDNYNKIQGEKIKTEKTENTKKWLKKELRKNGYNEEVEENKDCVILSAVKTISENAETEDKKYKIITLWDNMELTYNYYHSYYNDNCFKVDEIQPQQVYDCKHLINTSCIIDYELTEIFNF